MPSGNEPVTPAVIILSGLPGAGKTTFAHALAAHLTFDHHESDAIRREIFPRPRYTFAESRIVFTDVERRTVRSLQAGRVALIDATNLLEQHRSRFHGIAARFHARVLTVRVVAGETEIRARFSAPRDGYSQATVAVYESMRTTVEPSRHPAICVDSRYPFEPSLRLVARLLKESPSWMDLRP